MTPDLCGRCPNEATADHLCGGCADDEHDRWREQLDTYDPDGYEEE